MLIYRIIFTALSYLGTPYVWNAPSHQTASFDCSSFIQHVFGIHGIALPRSSREQFQIGTSVAFSNLQRGDILFFTTKQRKKKRGIAKVGHVGLYLGNNYMLHTYREGRKVTISELNSHWRSAFMGAKRIEQPQ
ncbi:C40 family peptidase [Ectobacillus panaciterrae]|uniref:C40 family peptidase n=1 Tax=Ectobacillus panaciterrae TaxID=363872 RepID=UPI0004047167|nr:C40 family peptidase [Ectobacillus panaciterrae]